MDWIRRRIGGAKSSEAPGSTENTAIGEMISSKAPGTDQQSIKNTFNNSTFNINNAGDVNMAGSANHRNEVKDGQESSSRSRLEDLDTFDCTGLKDYYSTTLCKASPLPWCHWYTWDIDEVYTELALENSKTPKFGVEGLFEQWDEPNWKGTYRILIEGDAGYGKSTLMLKIASDWSKTKSDSNDYTSRFSLLFVVKLGHVGEDGNLLSYMDSIYEEQTGKKVKDLLKSKGAVLVLLDGYDEANAKTKREVNQIMKRETMSKCHVVLTSRCGHVPDHVKRIALPVRVTGFGRRQVAEAVGKFFNKTDKPLSLEQFMGKLRAESPYKELAQCPLLCVMMCCLVSDCPNELPSTVSGLYFAMINRNLYRADRKKAEAAGEVEEQWDLSDLDSRVRQGHESYLLDFGRLCINGLKTGSMTFSLLDITGKKEAAVTTDDKVTQLIEAGVLVQDTNERNPIYQVPHRTTAEFLAAYCLSSETDQNLCQNLLDLFRLDASFDGVTASLVEMGKTKCLADAFRGIKFPYDCLTRFMKSYFFEHGAVGTWMEFKDALPNKIRQELKGHQPFTNTTNYFIKIVKGKLSVANTSGTVTISSAEPNQSLLHLCEGLCKGNTRETNARPSFPKDCLVSVKVTGMPDLELLQTLSRSGVGLERFDFHLGSFANEGKTSNEVADSLQELLKSHSCPVQFSCTITKAALSEAMQAVPEGCRLKSFKFKGSDWDVHNTTPLEEVLAEKWLSHLQHLGYKGFNPKPILKRLREPGCSLTSLRLYKCKLDIEDLMMLASKLETLSLKKVQLDFDKQSLFARIASFFARITGISKYAVKERCSLKSLRLKNFACVRLSLKGSLPSVDENQELLLAWRNVALHLEELTIKDCKVSIELFSWLNLSLPNLRTVAIGAIYENPPNGDYQFYANQVLEALTRSSGDSIEELSLLKDFWRNQDELMLHPIREALQRCPRMKSVNLGYLPDTYKVASIGPGPSTPLSPSDEEALKSDNNYYALLKIVLSVPKLQNLTAGYFFDKWEEIGTFHAIADKAEKWPAETNDNNCKTSLTLHGLSNRNAVNAMHVFRERGLEYCFRYVTEDVYEFWFPPRVVTPFQSV